VAQSLPSIHKAARAAGRVVFFCSQSDGLGAFLWSLTAGIAFSLLTERALILHCERGENPSAESLTRHLAAFFVSDYFDWSWPVEGHWPERPRTVELTAESVINQDFRPELFGNDTAVVLVANEHSGVDRLLRNTSGSRRRLEALLGPPEELRGTSRFSSREQAARAYDAWMIQAVGCLLRFYLGPTRHLLELEERIMRTYRLRYTPDGMLIDAVGLHMRFGDGWMVAPQSRWLWATDKYHHAAESDLPGVLGGLAAASSTATGCRGCVAVMDADWAARNTTRLYPAVALTAPTTGGRPVHFGASQNISGADVDRLFLDWWLLARSAAIAVVRPSTFSKSASHYRSAFSFSRTALYDYNLAGCAGVPPPISQVL